MTNFKTPLAWHNLLHQPVRSGVRSGVMFAAVLMFMQLGFLEAVKASATVTYDILRFDICIRSRDYARLSDARFFDRARLHQALEVEGVTTATPLWIGMFSWCNPKTGEPRAILAGRSQRRRCFSRAPPARAGAPETESAAGDAGRYAHAREFGPSNDLRFGSADMEKQVEINDRKLSIAGHFHLRLRV